VAAVPHRDDFRVADGIGRRVVPHLDRHGLVAVRDEHRGDDARAYRSTGDGGGHATVEEQCDPCRGAECERPVHPTSHRAWVPALGQGLWTRDMGYSIVDRFLQWSAGTKPAQVRLRLASLVTSIRLSSALPRDYTSCPRSMWPMPSPREAFAER